MNCTACGHENPAINRFCGGCGAALARACPSCDHANPPDHRFCGACGASLVAPAGGRAETRKVVTIVFADLIGSMGLHERLDPESVSRVMERYHRTVRAPVEAHGGTVVQIYGDGVMCAFGVPHVAEDDALRAVRAAVDVQRAFREFTREEREVVGSVGLRVAVNTGEVVVSDDYAAGIGDPLNVAARLQQEARDGDVLIGESTQRLVAGAVTLEHVGVFALKGRAESVAAYRVVSLERPAGGAVTAFVGREEELRRITAVYDSAVEAPGARLAVILGSPGLGKSRLIAELARRLGDPGSVPGPGPPGGEAVRPHATARSKRATILTARCDAAGGATFAPLAEALRAYLALDDSPSIDESAGDGDLRAVVEAALPAEEPERARIAAGVSALLTGTPAPPEETFFVVRRFLAGLAARQPVVLAIDDLQWAEPLLLDLTEHLVQWSTSAPLLVLVAARPELRDTRSSLAVPGGLVSEVVTLSGLDAGAATRLAANVIGADELPAAVAGRVLSTSEGNPLFVGELVRMLVQDGALKREGERWVAGVELAALEIPPTIQALLAARIERLKPEERTVLERASVVGRQFSRAAIMHLLPGEITDLGARLESLKRSELIEPDTGWLLGEPALRFHHVLIRDAAYRRLLKGTRVELHGRFADWLVERVGEAVEHEETIGWHLEQAHQHLRDLGPLDEQGRALGERASRYLAAAGRRALRRDDLPLAASLLGRAVERLEEADPGRADLALDWCEALLTAGDVGPAARAIDELGRLLGEGNGTSGRAAGVELRPEPVDGLRSSPEATAPRSRLRAWHTCFAGELAVLTDPQALRATAEAVASAAEELAAAGDAAGEAKAYFVHALALVRLGKIGACEAALDRALAAARRGRGDRRRANAVLAGAPLAALWGPSPVTRASGRCLDVVRVLRITQGAPAVEAVALRCQAVLEALRGRGEAARRMIASSRCMVEELGITQGLLETEAFAGLIELIEGNTASAEASLRAAYEGLKRHGLAIDAARAGALLGRTLLAQDRGAEAEELSHESESLAGDDLQAAITWRRVRAEALARRGEHAAAVEFARAAVDIAATTDALLHHADARLAFAAALRAAGRPGEAAAEEVRAIDLWEAKGASVLAERARRTAGRVVQAQQGVAECEEPPPSVRRRVQPNAATANVARQNTVVAARDAERLPSLFAEGYEVVDHTTGASWDRIGTVESIHSLWRARDLSYHNEPLATLGGLLALCRMSLSASGAAGKKFDVGSYARDLLFVTEVDPQGRQQRVEFFAVDRLGEAIARLYERYSELLSDGPERARAAATARSVSTLVGPLDPDSHDTVFASNIEFVDHRRLGFGSARGAEQSLRGFRAQFEIADGVTYQHDEVLALRPDALLLHRTTSGTARAGGGDFEMRYWALTAFGADGLVTHSEWFDDDCADQALGRFDELTPGRGATPPASAPTVATKPWRRVRPNAATANAARHDAAIAARDRDAVRGLFAEHAEHVDHVNHVVGPLFGRDAFQRFLRLIFRADDLTVRHEPLATLGGSLALFRHTMSSTGVTGREFDVGAYESERIFLHEVDAEGRRCSQEVFAIDHLNDAIARLYERYAELLPDGPARARAAATARTIAVLLQPRPSFDGDVRVLALDVESNDFRTVGWGHLRGAGALGRALRAMRDLTDEFAMRADDVLDLVPNALLVRLTNSGKQRAGGGAFERNFCALLVFDSQGLVIRWEQFDVEREQEALARFDELTSDAHPVPEDRALAALGLPRARGEGGLRGAEWIPASAGMTERTAGPIIGPEPAERARRRVRANAATAHTARLDAAIAARDGDAIATSIADETEAVNHPTGTVLDRQGMLATWRLLLRAEEPRCRHEPLATLGDALALCRVSISGRRYAGTTFDVAAYEKQEVALIEVDSNGRQSRAEHFTDERLSDGVARLYERYAERIPDGPEHDRAAAAARSVAALLDPSDLARRTTAIAPEMEFVDHRPLGFARTRGAERFLEGLLSIHSVATDIILRVDDILCLEAGGLVMRVTRLGTARGGGGTSEWNFLWLWILDAQGLASRYELFDPDSDVEALARFDELASHAEEGRGREEVMVVPATGHIENAATRAVERLTEAWESRDWLAVVGSFPPEFHLSDRRKLMRLEIDRDQHIEFMRLSFELTSCRFPWEVLATRGERLALLRERFEVSDDSIGPSDVEYLFVIETNDRGDRIAEVLLDPEDLDPAYAELDGRYAAGEAACNRAVSGAMRDFLRAFALRDWDAIAAIFAPGLVVNDHRLLGWEMLFGPMEYVASLRSLVDLAPDTRLRLDHVSMSRHALLWVGAWLGSREGGAFETPWIIVSEHDALGKIHRVDQYDLDKLDEARTRFDAIEASASRDPLASTRPAGLHPDPLRIPPNVAIRAVEAFGAAAEARDWDALERVFAPEFAFEDRRRGIAHSGDRTMMLASIRVALASRPLVSLEPLATAGDHLALLRTEFSIMEGDTLVAEIAALQLFETDDDGRLVAIVGFDVDDRRRASIELMDRFARTKEGAASPVAIFELRRGMIEHDIARCRAALPDDFVFHDHRRTGAGRLEGADEYVRWLADLFELSPDALIQPLYELARSEHGVLAIGHTMGTLPEGGAFESVFVQLVLWQGERLVGAHLFELEDLDLARARFEALRPDSARSSSNAL